MNLEDLQHLLDEKYRQYNQAGFIKYDPIQIPHRFTLKQDIEIAGFFAAILSWGNRKTIIQNCSKLMALMDDSPYDFIVNHQESDLPKLNGFVHRTFNSTDLYFIIEAFRRIYKQYQSLEPLFMPKEGEQTVKTGLERFHNTCFEFDFAPLRSKKHISTPSKKSACKRLNMYLRWMVRTDKQGVDFGIWQQIKPAQLITPLDVHVQRTALELGLLKSEKSDWDAAESLTESLRQFDPEDPVKYDFALFGMGIESKFGSRLL